MWAALEGDLRQEATAIDSEEFDRSLVEPFGPMMASFRTAIHDVAAVLSLYRIAWDALGSLAPDLSDVDRRWARGVGEARSVQLQASLTALGYVAHLEVVMPTLVEAMATEESLKGIAHRMKVSQLPHRVEVLGWASPTRDVEKWPRRMGAVFGLELSNAGTMALMTLLEARRVYLYQNQTLGTRLTLPSELNAWGLATLVLVGNAMRVVSERVLRGSVVPIPRG